MVAQEDTKDDVVGGRTHPHLLLDVDLEIESQHDLQPLINEFEPAAYSLERPAGRACFELNSGVMPAEFEPVDGAHRGPFVGRTFPQFPAEARRPIRWRPLANPDTLG
jgi:hypothetical protein